MSALKYAHLVEFIVKAIDDLSCSPLNYITRSQRQKENKSKQETLTTLRLRSAIVVCYLRVKICCFTEVNKLYKIAI